MVWFGLTGIPLILLWLGWEKAKELWKSGFFNPKSRYFRFHGKIVLFVEVVACFVLAFAVFPYLMMHFDPIYAFFMRTVVKWLEPSFDFMMHITSMFFDSVFGFVMDMLVKLISVL